MGGGGLFRGEKGLFYGHFESLLAILIRHQIGQFLPERGDDSDPRERDVTSSRLGDS